MHGEAHPRARTYPLEVTPTLSDPAGPWPHHFLPHPDVGFGRGEERLQIRLRDADVSQVLKHVGNQAEMRETIQVEIVPSRRNLWATDGLSNTDAQIAKTIPNKGVYRICFSLDSSLPNRFASAR
jgi:hypothetical protein